MSATRHLEWLVGRTVSSVDLRDGRLMIRFDNGVLLDLEPMVFTEQPRTFLAVHQYKDNNDWEPEASKI